MGFRVTGLAPAEFEKYRNLDDEELAAHRAWRLIAESGSGMFDRIALRHAEAGERVLLVNYEHQTADTPFRALHAVYVIEGAARAAAVEDELPPALLGSFLSIRAFDRQGMMVDAHVAEGGDARQLVERLLDAPGVDYLHAHFARRVCYAARIERRM